MSASFMIRGCSPVALDLHAGRSFKQDTVARFLIGRHAFTVLTSSADPTVSTRA
ncbi:Hypothetical Protein RSKD131_3797 [Cereibacter sphaeroides KD131]|jgi:hypothetical protein|nr:Hypothetical Protein RSKD131_3797 [Cereibacter sphaeroides KD131]